MVYTVSLESPCDMTMLFIYSNTLARFALAKESAKVMTVDLPYGLNSSKFLLPAIDWDLSTLSFSGTGYIALEGKIGCDFDLTVRPDVFHAWYLVSVVYGYLSELSWKRVKLAVDLARIPAVDLQCEYDDTFHFLFARGSYIAGEVEVVRVESLSELVWMLC